MPDEHVYEKSDIVERLEKCLNRTLGSIDTKGIFESLISPRQGLNDETETGPVVHQKGIAGTVIEQCVFEYDPDCRQEADLIIIDEGERIRTELKSTGMRVDSKPTPHYIAKEPMSITAVGIYEIGDEEFSSSEFWDKLEHMLIVYYLYDSNIAVQAYDYRTFPVKGYEFHEFSEDDIKTLKKDWEYVHDLCAMVVSHHSGEHDVDWKNAVRDEYIEVHGQLRQVLSYIDLAPKYPPRFRLKKPIVSSIIADHFGGSLEQVPGTYVTVSDIDVKCAQLTERYSGKTMKELAREFGVTYLDSKLNKNLAEQIVVAMFGGKAKRLNDVEVFNKFGLVAKTITLNSRGGRTEDMKLFRVDFAEITQKDIDDDTGDLHRYDFEDSELYSYFADNELLCILFEEPPHSTLESVPLDMNKFVGFKRLIFDDEFIDTKVRFLWKDTRDKILNETLVDEIYKNSDGSPVVNKSGNVKSAPNFLKSKENVVFLRGGGIDSSLKNKTECVNGIAMLPQYVWIKGSSIVDELKKIN